MPPKVNLWREGWSACKRNVRELAPWAFGFTFLIVICNFYSMQDEILSVQERIKSVADTNAVLPGHISMTASLSEHVSSPVSRLARLCASLIELAAFYYFSVTYLRREPLTRKPEFGAAGFFYWLGQIALAGLCIIGLALAVILAGAAVGMVVSFIFNGNVGVVAAATSVATICAVMYAGVKFILAGPFAVSRIPSPVKNSWRISDGNWLRLIWNHLMLASVVWLILFGVFLVPFAALFVYTPATADSVIFVGGLSIIMGFCSIATLATGSVYCCVAGRVLLQERSQELGLPATRESGSIN